TLLESRYLYDPLGRRIGKRVWKSHRYEDGSRTRPEITESVWYGWDGDRLTTTETDTQRIQTIYLPGSFTPLVRIETETSELLKAARRTLAEKFQQEANVTFPTELVTMVDNLEAELQRGELSEASRAWLAQCGLTPEQIQNQIEPEYTPQRKIHLYHCDHRGLPLALVSHDGKVEWSAEYDAWGNVLRENNPHNLKQLIRLPGQQYDEETGLYYNRHRYYYPLQGRYITQDPIGLMGGWNLYVYADFKPVLNIDPLGLDGWSSLQQHLSQPGFQSEALNAMFYEPWYKNAGAREILNKTHNDMIRLNLAESDQFFHCSAFCRVSKSYEASQTYAIFLGALKEKRDGLLNEFGLYGRGKLSDFDMAMDSAKDLKVNHHGLTCPPEQSCSDRCKQYINSKHTSTIEVLKREGYME
ncbi:RHS repeat protein, partial [Salmonella bongori]|nr:RHS repeat protein [Salmonella bongori]